MQKRFLFMIVAPLLALCLISEVGGQESKKPFSLEDVERLLKEGVSSKGIGRLIGERGVSFEVTVNAKERLLRAGAGPEVLQALERIALEQERKKLEGERKRLEEARRKAEEEARHKAAEPQKVITGKDGAEMALIPAGEFWMGSEDSDAQASEKPRRRVYLDAFYIDKYEVTNVLYSGFIKVVRQTALGYRDNSNFNGVKQPALVSWHDADAYCKWAGKHLPTEAEWEKVARGTDGRKYPWGDQWDSSRANSIESKLGRTAAVGSYPSGMSPYGVHDMAGNVWEWVADWYEANYYQSAPNRNPKGPGSGQYRVFRGGSWTGLTRNLFTSARGGGNPTSRYYFLGFRCAQDVR